MSACIKEKIDKIKRRRKMYNEKWSKIINKLIEQCVHKYKSVIVTPGNDFEYYIKECVYCNNRKEL